MRNQKRGVPRVCRNTVRSCARGTRLYIVTYYCELEKGGSVESPGSATGTTPFSANSACVTAGSRNIAGCVIAWNRLPVARLATLFAFHCYYTVSL